MASIQFQQLAERLKLARTADPSRLRLVNTQKLKNTMLSAAASLRTQNKAQSSLAQSLSASIQRISEQSFISAIMSLQPLKIQGKARMVKEQDETKTNSSSLLSPDSKSTIYLDEDQLLRELGRNGHPFVQLCQSFSHILQNKYKLLGQRQGDSKLKLEDVSQQLRKDVEALSKILIESTIPLLEALCMTTKNHSFQTASQLIQKYICSQEYLNLTLKKILRFHSQRSLQMSEFDKHCPMEAIIEDYDLPLQFRIQGAYVFTTSKIVELTQSVRPNDSLNILTEIRHAIMQDIDQYQKMKGQKGQSEVGSEIQLQILKFLLAKLRIFGGDLLASLRLLQVQLGDQMAFHYDQASYMHSQLEVAFEAIQQQL